jgi:cyclohexyl-isocyanide hydratase
LSTSGPRKAPIQVGYLLYPSLTQLDLTGPMEVLTRLPDVEGHVVARTSDAVRADCGLRLLPTTTYDSCPPLDVILVPGGLGVVEAIRDPETVAFLRLRAQRARYITSVCTGAFLLGAIGLLRGKRATTHWAYHELLSAVGAIPVRERVARDGSLITAAGVTAGIELALAVAAEIAGVEMARGIQLRLEYGSEARLNTGAGGGNLDLLVDSIRKSYLPRISAVSSALGLPGAPALATTQAATG